MVDFQVAIVLGGGGGNLNQLMKQAQKMQEEMAKAQEEIANLEVEGSLRAWFKSRSTVITALLN